MYLEKIVGPCEGGPAYIYDATAEMTGDLLTLVGDLVCADTGETAPGFEDAIWHFSWGAEDETFHLDGSLSGMGRVCTEPAPTPEGGGVNVIEGTVGDDILIGTDGDDEIKGKTGIDILCGFGGRDSLNGGGDHDVLLGGKKKDDMRGKSGVDYLDGGPHKDKLFGNGGNDFLHGDNHDDKIFGGDGHDVAHGGKHTDGDKCDAEDETKCELDF